MWKILSTFVTLAFLIGFGAAIYRSFGEAGLEEKKQIEVVPSPPAPAPSPPPPSIPQQAIPPQIAEEKPKPVEIVPLKGFFEDKLSPHTTLHAVGIYEGENESGKEDPPWWSKCQDFTKGNSDSEAARNCHQKYASIRSPKTVTVNIGYTKSPVVVVLMAYDPVIWKINRVVHGVDIEGIILAGYEEQTLVDVPAATRVIAYTHKTPECGDCIRGEGYFYAYSRGPELQQAAEKLLKITGKQLASFQGSYKAHQFRISNNID